MSTGRLVDQRSKDALKEHCFYDAFLRSLRTAYDGKRDRSLRLARAIGIDTTSLPPATATDEVLWVALVDAAFDRRVGGVGALVHEVLCDPDVAGHHPLIRTWAELDLDAALERYFNAALASQGFQEVLTRYVDLGARPEHARRRPATGGPDFSWVDVEVTIGEQPELAATYIPYGDDQAKPIEDVQAHLARPMRAVLLGDPGSGKTWTLRRLFLRHALAWMNSDAEARPNLPIPVLVPLQGFRLDDGQGFGTYMASWLGDELAPLWAWLLQRRQLVLLLDAFNEMPRPPDRAQATVDAIKAELRGLERFVLSCRVKDYGQELRDLKGLEQMILQDLDPPKMQQLIRVYLVEDSRADGLWAKMGGSDALMGFWEKVAAKGEAKRFWDERQGEPSYTRVDEDSAWRAMHRGARLIPLARNPFILANLCKLFAAEGSLPASRAGLFKRLTGLLLDRAEKDARKREQPWQPRQRDEVVAVMTEVALVMQRAATTSVSYGDALQGVSHADAHRLLDAALDARLLRRDGDGDGAPLHFEHQLFQEYFVARQLVEDLEAGISPAPYFRDGEGWWDPHVWRETWTILGELLGEGAAGPNRVARWLAPISPDVALDVLTENGSGLTIQDHLEPETRQALIDGAHALTTEAHPYGRAAAWRVLGRLDADRRPGVGLFVDPQTDVPLPDIDWVPIAGGPFHYQKGKPGARIITLSPFQIARYPVTWTQFQTFVDAADGYASAAWWDGLNKRREQARDARWPISNHPRETVDWDEAMAFCRWLTARLHAAGKLAADQEVRLPLEEEWERAARGPGEEGREYPWGEGYQEGRANIDETGTGIRPYYLRRTSAVGAYPYGGTPAHDDETPEGILDLAGNVWEWCSNEYANPDRIEPGGDAVRVMRGGSWYRNHVFARAAFRSRPPPANWSSFLGFRLVISSPISPGPLAAGAA